VVAFIAGHATEAVTTNPDAGRVVNDGYYYGHGFFGFFGFPRFALSVILIFALIRWTIGRRRGGGGRPYGGRYWHQQPREHGSGDPQRPDRASGSHRARPRAAWHGRPRCGAFTPPRGCGSHHHADRPHRRVRQAGWPGARRRRLRHQAV